MSNHNKRAIVFALLLLSLNIASIIGLANQSFTIYTDAPLANSVLTKSAWTDHYHQDFSGVANKMFKSLHNVTFIHEANSYTYQFYLAAGFFPVDSVNTSLVIFVFMKSVNSTWPLATIHFSFDLNCTYHGTFFSDNGLVNDDTPFMTSSHWLCDFPLSTRNFTKDSNPYTLTITIDYSIENLPDFSESGSFIAQESLISSPASPTTEVPLSTFSLFLGLLLVIFIVGFNRLQKRQLTPPILN